MNRGIFQPYGGPITVAGNNVFNFMDPGCTGFGSCTCLNFQVQNNDPVTADNTCDTAVLGLYLSGQTAGNGTIFKGNICNNLTAVGAYPAIRISSHNMTELASSEPSVVTNLASPFNFGATPESLATWRGNGYDPHSLNSNASFNPAAAYLYILSAGCPGIGLTLGLGFFGENAGANQSVNGWQQ